MNMLEFNNEVIQCCEGNDRAVIYYISNNKRTNLYYHICRCLIDVMKERDVYFDSHHHIKKVVFKDKSMDALVEAIKDLKDRLYYFSFNQFYVMLLLRFHLALTDEERKEAVYLGNELQFKMELMRRLQISNCDTNSYRECLNRKFINLPFTRQELFSKLTAMKDTFLFQLGDRHYVSIGRCRWADTMKYAQVCHQSELIKQYQDICHFCHRKHGNYTHEEQKSFYEQYQKFARTIDNFMYHTREEETVIELIDFVEKLPEEHVMSMLKQIDFYYHMYREYF